MAKLIEDAQSVAPSASCLVVSQSAQTAVGGAVVEPWNNYVAALESLARSAVGASTLAAFSDLSPIWATGLSPNAANYYNNNHPNLSSLATIGGDLGASIASGVGDYPPAYLIASGTAVLAADVLIGTVTTVIQSTVPLPIGSYIVLWVVTVQPAAAASGVFEAEFEIVQGTATATITGIYSGAAGSASLAASKEETATVVMIANVVVTAEGQLNLTGIATTSGTGTTPPYAKAATQVEAFPAATGYQILRMR